jgi:hypothetical protein
MRGFFCRWPVAGEKAERRAGATVSFVFLPIPWPRCSSGSRGADLNLAQQKHRERLERRPP